MASSPFSEFKVPRLLASGHYSRYAYVTMETLPAGLKPVSYDEAGNLLADIEGRSERSNSSASVLFQSHWWMTLTLRRKRFPAAYEALHQSLIRHGLETCWDHGDFLPQNIFRSRDGIWLVDWERGDPHAPSLADQVNLFLAMNRNLATAEPVEFITKLRFSERLSRAQSFQLLAALAYLYSVGAKEAEPVLAHWHSQQECLA